MGLDAVEFVMEVEEEFGISIAEDEGVEYRTLGQFHDYFLEKCEGRQRPTYSTRSAFYRLRRALVAVFDIEPRSIRPSTLLCHCWALGVDIGSGLVCGVSWICISRHWKTGPGPGWGMLLASAGGRDGNRSSRGAEHDPQHHSRGAEPSVILDQFRLQQTFPTTCVHFAAGYDTIRP